MLRRLLLRWLVLLHTASFWPCCVLTNLSESDKTREQIPCHGEMGLPVVL
jgi:hypothetical protein